MFIRPLGKGRKGAFTGAKAIGLVLLAGGLMLMAFIVVNGSGIYKHGKATSDKQGLSSVVCVGYVYNVKNIQAKAGSLEFVFKNEISSTEDVHNLTITGESQDIHVIPVYIPPGSSETVSIPAALQGNFTVYPDNCGIYAAKCRAGGGECTYH